MLLLSLITFSLAITTYRLTQTISDEALQITFALITSSSICLSLVFTPWPLKLLLAAALLTLPTGEGNCDSVNMNGSWLCFLGQKFSSLNPSVCCPQQQSEESKIDQSQPRSPS